jgi:anthranilate synthase component 2
MSNAGRPTRLLMIDNYDSFTYNLVQYFGELGAQVTTVRNDAQTVSALLDRPAAERPQHIVISPGPCSPTEAGISVALIQAVAQMPKPIPLLGVCLGHQAIGAAFGAQVVRAKSIMHGKTSPVTHRGESVFKGLPNPLTVTRYHSLASARASLPPFLTVTAWTADEEIMGVQHETLPIHGVQFHPESILTEKGHDLLKNFLEIPSPL